MSGGDRGGISDKEKGLAAEALSKGRHYYSCKGGILEMVLQFVLSSRVSDRLVSIFALRIDT